MTEVVKIWWKCPTCGWVRSLKPEIEAPDCIGSFAKPHRRIKTFERAQVLTGGKIRKLIIGRSGLTRGWDEPIPPGGDA